MFDWYRTISLLKKKKFDDALKLLFKMRKKRPQDAKVIIEIARIYFKTGKYSDAKMELLKSLDLKLSNENISSILEITNWFRLCSEEFFNASPSFSYDGKSIIFVSARKDTNEDGKINDLDRGGIYIVDKESCEEKYIISDQYYNISPIFSPDGTKIAYLSVRRDTNEDGTLDYRDNPGLYLADLKKGIEIELLSDENKIKNISFSPDGNWIFFSCWLAGETKSGIYKININNKEIETVVSNEYENTFPVLSSDGGKLIFTSWREDTDGDGRITMRDNTGIFIKNLKDKKERCLVGCVYNNTFPSFSKDGKKALYLSRRRDTNLDGKIDNIDNSGIYIYDLDSNKEVCIQTDKYYNKFPSFNHDGTKVVFLGSWRGKKSIEGMDFFENKGIYCVGVDGKNLKQIVCEKYYGCRSPVTSPTSDEIAYLSWKKNTNRGLYLAYLDRYPTEEELRKIIEKNL